MAEKDRFVSPAGFRLYRLSSAPGSYSLFCRFRSWLQREAAMARVTRQQQQDNSVIKKVQRGLKKKKSNLKLKKNCWQILNLVLNTLI